MHEPPAQDDEACRLLRSVERLPRLSPVVQELLRLDSGADTYADDVMRAALADPELAEQVVALVGATPSAARHPLRTVSATIERVGSRAVSNLLAVLAAARALPTRGAYDAALWRHSIETAVIAQDIAEECSDGIDPAVAFVAGLLHDVGRFVLLESDARRAEARDGRSVVQSFLSAEVAGPRISHADVGWQVCWQWNLPESVCDIVLRHHAPTSAASPAAPSGALCLRVVQQADDLSALFEIDPHFARASFHERRDRIGELLRIHGDASRWTATRLAERTDVLIARARELCSEIGVDAAATPAPE
jgi:putative nucleotidyltransferase with HDIG domain